MKFRARIDGGSVTLAKIVEHFDLMTVVYELFNANTANVASATGDKKFHVESFS